MEMMNSDCEILQVKIISKEIIKLSFPTPPHLNNYKLSIFDQFCLNFYVPIVLFFKGPTTMITSSDVLKKSLSDLLTHLYALAGRVKDIYTIDCNDEGVEFVDAYVSNSISDLLSCQSNHYSHLIKQLLPYNQLVGLNELIINSKPLLGVQATYFGCGGIAIGVCVSHCVVDASSMATFLNNWAKLTLGEAIVLPMPNNNTCLFPPQDMKDFLNFYFQSEEAKSSNMATRRFQFDGSTISELRKIIAHGSIYVENPTRYEAVSALLWGANITISEETQADISAYLLNNSVDLRRRTSPPLPPNLSGSLSSAVASQWPAKKAVDYNCLAGKIRESIRKVDHQYIEILGSTDMTNAHKKFPKSSSTNKVKSIICSSWCKYPFYECDFGWGKPFRLATVPIHNGMAILLDNKDDDGIEVCLALDEEDMVKFEKNTDILKFSSK